MPGRSQILAGAASLGRGTTDRCDCLGEGAQSVSNDDSYKKSLSRRGPWLGPQCEQWLWKEVGYNARFGELGLPMRWRRRCKLLGVRAETGPEVAACVRVPRGSAENCRQSPRLPAGALRKGMLCAGCWV